MSTSVQSVTRSRLPLPPRAPGLPLLGNTLQLLNNPLAHLVSVYHELGPIFRIRMGFQEYTVIAGLEANQLLAREGERIFSSEGLFGGFARAMKTDVMLTVLDGPAHRHMRKVMQRGFARSAMAPHLPTMVDIVRQQARSWQPGQHVPVFRAMRQIVVDQLAVVAATMPVEDYFDDIITFLNTMLNVHALKVWPAFMLRRPAFLRARARIIELGQKVLDFHRQNPPEVSGRLPDLIDDILANVRPDGRDFTEDDLLSMSIGPYFAGMDTVASSISFFVYTLLKHPDALAQVQAEADALFASGKLEMQALRQMDALHAAAIEALRLYPVTPFTPRTAVEQIEFGGYRIDPGTEVMIAQTVTHMLPEYYPDPLRYDITRHMGGKSGPPPGVFAPFTLGAHTCLGAGLAEAQMMLTIAALVHTVDLELESPDYVVPVKTMPLPNPGNQFRMRVVRQRN